jgi:hypothetical protein
MASIGDEEQGHDIIGEKKMLNLEVSEPHGTVL